MTIGSVVNQGLAGIQQSQREMLQAAGDIATA